MTLLFRIPALAPVATLALLVAARPASATIVSGQVTDAATGNGLASIDIDLVDASGSSIPLTGDRTDSFGYYAVDAPAGTYTFQFEPPVGVRRVAVERAGVVVSGGSTTIDQALLAGSFLSARVVDELGAPLASVDLAAVAVPAGTPTYSPYDATDAAGAVRVVVAPGTHDVTFRPDAGSGVLAVLLPGVVVAGDTDLGTVVLPRALVLSGRVLGEDGPALPGTRVGLLDHATGIDLGIATLADATGSWQLEIGPGTYRVVAAPPAGAPYVGRTVHAVDVAADRQLPDLLLDRALALRGLVQSVGGPEPGVDVDVTDALTGRRVSTPRDDTDASGRFEVFVRPGVYDVAFEPPASTNLASARVHDQAILADTTLPTVTLARGYLVSGRVISPGGPPAPGVDVDAVPPSGPDLPLPDDVTDAGGAFRTRVPAGTYTFEFEPQPRSGWGAARLVNVAVSSDMTLPDVVLPPSAGATVSTVDPVTGPETGGTLVLVSGAAFEVGARAFVGGMPLRDVVVTSPTTLQGTTSVRPAGIVDVTVTNPGATPSTLSGGFEYLPAAGDPLIFLRRDGPLDNDVLVEWDATGQIGFLVFRSREPWTLGLAEAQAGVAADPVTGGRWRDEGGALGGGLVFYVVR